MQHDIYSWQVDGTNLVRIQELTDESGSTTMNDLNSLPSSELYAIRPILPDEADYEG